MADQITRKFRSCFAADVVAAGEALLNAGKAHVYEGGVAQAGVEVEGAFCADVRLEVNAGTLAMACDCPEALAGEPCLHMWAALLALDQVGDLGLAAKRSVAKLAKVVGRSSSVASATAAAAPPPRYEPIDAEPGNRGRPSARRAARPVPAAATPPVAAACPANLAPTIATAPAEAATSCEVNYIIDLQASRSRATGDWVIATSWRNRTAAGHWGPRRELLPQGCVQLPLWADTHLLDMLAPHWLAPQASGSSLRHAAANCFALPPTTLPQIMPHLAQTGRLYWRHNGDDQHCVAIAWDAGEPWQLQLQFAAEAGQIRAQAALVRHQESLDLEAPLLLSPGGLVLTWTHLGFYDDCLAYSLLQRFRHRSNWSMSLHEADAMVRHALTNTRLELTDLPAPLHYEATAAAPQPQLFVRTARYKYRGREQLHADLSFRYGGVKISANADLQCIVDPRQHRLYRRNAAVEQACQEVLRTLGFRYSDNAAREEVGWKLLPAELDGTVRSLLELDWTIVAEGKTYRKPEDKQASIRGSGQDWFELHVTVRFSDEQVPLPELLKALKAGSSCVLLGDGSFGVLPVEWLSRYTVLTEIGEIQGDSVRFRRGQAALLAALLDERPEVDVDAAFAQTRAQLASFAHDRLLAPPADFHGSLRNYQQVGLAWLTGLRQLGLGGCLADDMGLGKTVQVLAFLQLLHDQRVAKPSLIVMPKSLISNWIAEAARFTPQLRITIHTGSSRGRDLLDVAAGADLILTTYGTLRQDAAMLRGMCFACCILDESQAIKNAEAAVTKAARLVQADFRLTMTGTPIENHLGELFSQFEFLNPGMLGNVGALSRYSLGQHNLEPEQIEALARALRPLILRRTKAQVAKELPPKTEQVLYCELYPEQRLVYDELKHYYRQQLLAQRQTKDNKIQALEALLRLRQAACHTGLIHDQHRYSQCAKLDLLLEKVDELCAEGHKLLVFSQFTGFLALARQRLDQAGIVYAYLDGQTADRQAQVARFQNDPAVPLFLISLKAGGVGLNLTAADYVMLLDPWWNPAVEAQAIDRAYRIGQTRHVFAYRLIAADTVEERVLAMQEDKRDLADSLIRADTLSLAKLTRDDLAYLLG